MGAVGGILLAGLLIPVAVLLSAGFVILVAAAISGGRHETDPDGERTTAIYLGVTNWVAMFVALMATFAIVASVVSFIHSGDSRVALQNMMQSQVAQAGGSASSGFGTSGPIGPGSAPLMREVSSTGPGVTTAALAAALVALAAGAVLALYARRLWALVGDERRRRGPAGPAVRVYLLAATFTAVFIAVGAGASALFGLYRVIAPGVAGLGAGHDPGLRQLIDSAYLAFGALVILRVHHRAAFPQPAAPVPPEVAPSS